VNCRRTAGDAQNLRLLGGGGFARGSRVSNTMNQAAVPVLEPDMRKCIARKFQAFLLDEAGPTATEYAVLLALILLVVFGSVTVLGTNLNSKYLSMNAAMFGG
jgi:Flp pilus assembly pilin Flp